VPLLAVALDRIVRTVGQMRRSWIVATVATYAVAFMWFNAWLYRASLRLQAHYPTYVQDLDVAIDQMTRCDKLLIVATHPLLFFAVAVTAIAARTDSPVREG
jgi:hypothetical protein